MEPSPKRPRLSSVFPDPIPPSQPLETARRQNDNKLRSAFQSIFDKYSRDFSGIGDELDLKTGQIIVNNGHIQRLEHETDIGTWKRSPRKQIRGAGNNRRTQRAKTPGGRLLSAVMMQNDTEQEHGYSLTGMETPFTNQPGHLWGPTKNDNSDRDSIFDEIHEDVPFPTNTQRDGSPDSLFDSPLHPHPDRSPTRSIDSLLEMTKPIARATDPLSLESPFNSTSEEDLSPASTTDYVASWIAGNPLPTPPEPSLPSPPKPPSDHRPQRHPRRPLSPVGRSSPGTVPMQQKRRSAPLSSPQISHPGDSTKASSSTYKPPPQQLLPKSSPSLKSHSNANKRKERSTSQRKTSLPRGVRAISISSGSENESVSSVDPLQGD